MVLDRLRKELERFFILYVVLGEFFRLFARRKWVCLGVLIEVGIARFEFREYSSLIFIKVWS